MPYKDGFRKIIESFGGGAFLLSENGEDLPFRASIQPIMPSGGGTLAQISRIGAGEINKYRFYTPRDAVTAGIKEGDGIMYQGCVYLVERIEDMSLYGDVYFREGTLRKTSPCGYGEEG